MSGGGDMGCGKATRAGVAMMAAALAAILGLGGCVSLLPQSKPIQLYEFGQAPPPPSELAAPNAVGVSLGVVHMPPDAVTDQILTLTGQQSAYIAGARWVTPAGVMFQADAQRAFEARSRRVRLLHAGDLAAAGAILRLDVGDFEARYDAAGAAPTVVVSVHASLTRLGKSTVAGQTFTVRVRAQEDRVSMIAAAFDKAVINVLEQVVDWTDANAPPPSAPMVTTTKTSTTDTSTTDTSTTDTSTTDTSTKGRAPS